MTGRDRIVVIVVVILALLGGGWILVVSPKSKEAGKLGKQVSEAQSQLTAAQGQLANARAAQSQYSKAYVSIVSLGKAVPPSQEVPSLIYQLSQATNAKHVDFSSIASTTSNTPGSGSAASAAAAAASAGFSQMPFTFVFNGSFFDLEHLFHEIDGFVVRKASGELDVRGRLLTIQGIKLSPTAESESAGKRSKGKLMGTITATAYVLPAGQGLTGGATPGAPGAGSASAAKPVAASAASSPTPSAVAKVGP